MIYISVPPSHPLTHTDTHIQFTHLNAHGMLPIPTNKVYLINKTKNK